MPKRKSYNDVVGYTLEQYAPDEFRAFAFNKSGKTVYEVNRPNKRRAISALFNATNLSRTKFKKRKGPTIEHLGVKFTFFEKRLARKAKHKSKR